MPLKITHPDHFEIVGRGVVLLSNPPRPNVSSDSYTGKIVEEIALLSKAHAIIGKEAKGVDVASSSQVGISEFDTALERMCGDNGIRCILVIRGKKEPGIEIKTEQMDPSAKEITELVRDGFAVDFDVKVATEKTENDQAPSGQGHPQVISLELGPDVMGYRRDIIVGILADTIALINGRLGYSEGPSDVLN